MIIAVSPDLFNVLASNIYAKMFKFKKIMLFISYGAIL